MATSLGKLAKWPLFRSIWKYGSSDFKIFNGNIVATLCASLVKIGPVTLEFKKGVCGIFMRLSCNLTTVLHSAHWHSETNWNVVITIAACYSAMNSVHCIEIL